jgi:hypothetical protein
MMGWKQSATVTDEDNSACVAAAAIPHITRGLRHLELDEHYLKEKTQDGTCFVVKEASATSHHFLEQKLKNDCMCCDIHCLTCCL